MRWVSFAATTVLVLFAICLLLLAYRVVDKPRGQDAAYDAAIDYWSDTFKALGWIGIVVLTLEVLTLWVNQPL